MVRNEILKLREEGFSYNQISEKLKCAKATISYHCKKWSLNDIGLYRKVSFNKDEIQEYYKNHTKKETAAYFKISESTVMRYNTRKKRILLNESERKKKKYVYVQSFRQKIKQKAIEYKGGKCIICGYDKCSRSMDFHHRNPNEKDFTIGSFKILDWNKIKKELDKCDLLCKNCHGELHEKIEKEKNK